MGHPGIVYRPIPDAEGSPGVRPEAELSALVGIYSLAIRKAEEKAGVRGAGENNPKGDLHDRADSILHRAG